MLVSWTVRHVEAIELVGTAVVDVATAGCGGGDGPTQRTTAGGDPPAGQPTDSPAEAAQPRPPLNEHVVSRWRRRPVGVVVVVDEVGGARTFSLCSHPRSTLATPGSLRPTGGHQPLILAAPIPPDPSVGQGRRPRPVARAPAEATWKCAQQGKR